MNGNTKEIKYSLSREEMIDLLKKYPFLVYSVMPNRNLD